MNKNLLKLNDEMIKELQKQRATHYSIAKNFDRPHVESVSSVHFFKSDKKDSNGNLSEVAYFLPEMHSKNLGEMSGFNVVSRKNSIDIDIKELPEEYLPKQRKSFKNKR